MSRRGTAGRALLLVLGLALAAWGLAVTVPHLADAQPGYLAKNLYPVMIWGMVAVACLAGLAYLIRKP